MKPVVSIVLTAILASVASVNAMRASEGRITPPGAVITYPLPLPEVRFVARFSNGSSSISYESPTNLLTPFRGQPFDDMNRYSTVTLTIGEGSSTGTYILDPFTGDFADGWQVTGSVPADLLGIIYSWYGTSDPYYNPDYQIATEVTSTFMKVPYLQLPEIIWTFKTWTLSGPVPPRAVTNASSSPWSEWSEWAPVASLTSDGAGGSSRLNCEYKLVASPLLAGRKLHWDEVFYPADGGAAITTPREWTVRANESPVFTLSPTSEGSSVAINLTLDDPQPELAVDANRDGTITLSSEDAADATSAVKPFRFWINDDVDTGDVGGPRDYSDPSSSEANYKDQTVNGTSDLIDFFPVFLDLKQLLMVLPPSASVKYKLKQANSAVNFVYTNLSRKTTTTRDGALAYHKKIFTTGFGPDLNQAAGAATTQQITTEGIELASAFLTGIKDADCGVILIEGRAATTAPLVLSVEKDGTVITDVNLDLRISNVEGMFRHVDLTQVPKKYDGSTYTIPEPVPAPHTGDPGEAWPDSQTNGKYFIFLHGFNVDGQRARGWNSEIFKRLHVLGSKARFVGVTWHGATGIKLGGSYTDYHGAVFNAFQTGDALAGALSFTGSADVTIAAHSLGNIVASQAIQSGGFVPARYYMINGASPIEAYDLTNMSDTQITRMTESKWKRGAPGNRSSYAANWHQFFEVTPSDHRAELKWKNRFSDVVSKIHNFYSPGDDVVEDPEWDSPSILGLIFTQGFNFSRGAWVTQEFAKGANVGESIAAINLSRVQGGWGESVLYTPPWGIGSGPSSPNQIEEPYFGYFLEHDLFDVDSAKASAKAAQKFVQYDLLARGIPTLSFAMAVHPLKPLENPNTPSLSRNFDMEVQGRDSGVWPIDGHSADGMSAGRWLHSDFKNVALPYVHKTYEEMINRGSLK